VREIRRPSQNVEEPLSIEREPRNCQECSAGELCQRLDQEMKSLISSPKFGDDEIRGRARKIEIYLRRSGYRYPCAEFDKACWLSDHPRVLEFYREEVRRLRDA